MPVFSSGPRFVISFKQRRAVSFQASVHDFSSSRHELLSSTLIELSSEDDSDSSPATAVSHRLRLLPSKFVLTPDLNGRSNGIQDDPSSTSINDKTIGKEKGKDGKDKAETQTQRQVEFRLTHISCLMKILKDFIVVLGLRTGVFLDLQPFSCSVHFIKSLLHTLSSPHLCSEKDLISKEAYTYRKSHAFCSL
ncbi:unnamed protein product [Lactuca virosa]|uniref:Uncharacterized protein n=1 Tax=Lactuca virosa TaxID=75947 RepID=A0AAU9N310_9ASTR|nr:unnamed protein product [Lactuca virosa]